MNVSVIIVSYYTGASLWLAIESALAQAECKEVILVNNGNLAGEQKKLLELSAQNPKIKLLTGHGNIGFGKACNLGVANASSEFVLLLNPDSFLPENAFANIIAEIQNYPANTLAGCALTNSDGTLQRGSRRALMTPQNMIIESLHLNKISNKFAGVNFHQSAMPENTIEVPAISGAFMFLSREFYQKLGGFDENYFLHMEDMDFCYRVNKAGGKIIFIPNLKVIHFKSTSEVASSVVEKHKAKGFIRYLSTHFNNKYLPVLFVGIWLRYYLKRISNFVDKLFIPPIAAKNEIARLVLLYRLTANTAPANGKTILVTGASTPTGLAIIGKSLALGYKVLACYNRTKIPFVHENLKWLKFDLSKPDEIANFNEIKTDVFFHAAKLSLLPALLGNETKRIIVVAENIENEKELFKQNSEMTILRPLMPYGVGFGDYESKLIDIINRFGILPVYKKAEGLRNPVLVLDVADVALKIINNPDSYGKLYDLGGKQTLSYREILLNLFEYVGKKPCLIQIPFMPQILNLLGKIYQYEDINGNIAQRMNQNLVKAETFAI